MSEMVKVIRIVWNSDKKEQQNAERKGSECVKGILFQVTDFTFLSKIAPTAKQMLHTTKM